MPPPPKKKKGSPPKSASPELQRSRAKGALLGLAVGEALGLPLEGRTLHAPPFPSLADGPYLDMKPDGLVERRAGQTGIVTAMAAALASVLQNDRNADVESIARGYLRLREVNSRFPDNVMVAMELLAEGRSPLFAGRQAYYEAAEKHLDAVPMARAVPLALAHKDDQQTRTLRSLECAGITHFAPLARLASAALNGLIAAAVTTTLEAIDIHASSKAVETELSLAAATLGRLEPDVVQQTKDAFEFLKDDFDSAQRSDPKLYGPELHLFGRTPTARIAWRLALWELFHAPSFEAGLVDVVNRGGTTSVNGAVCGALLGAKFGAEAIAETWSEAVIRVGHQFEGAAAREFDVSAMLQLAYAVTGQ